MLKTKGCKKIYHISIKQKKTGILYLYQIKDKVYLSATNIIRDKEDHFMI